MDHLAPPQPAFNLNATMTSLQSGSVPILDRSNRWSKYKKAPKDMDCTEIAAFQPMEEIFTAVTKAIIENSQGKLTEDKRTVDFWQNPNGVPMSNDRKNLSRPDGYSTLKGADKKSVKWDDITLSCEYKKKDGGDDLDDVRFP
jgi:hypothetical protein